MYQEDPLSVSFQILIAEFWCDVQRNRILKKSSLSKNSNVAFFIFFSSEALITNISKCSKCVSTYIKIYPKQMSFEGSHASSDRPPSILT